MADPLELRYCRRCVTIANFDDVGQSVWAYVGSLKNFWDARALPRWDRNMADPSETWYSPTCYCAKFGHCLVMEICHKILTQLTYRLSMSLSVIGTDMDRSTNYDFLTVP